MNQFDSNFWVQVKGWFDKFRMSWYVLSDQEILVESVVFRKMKSFDDSARTYARSVILKRVERT